MSRRKYSKFVMENTTGLQRFLWNCAGANVEALAISPDDWRKQSVIGTMVIVTAMMAFISSGLYLRSMGVSVPGTAFGASFWGTVIFIVDRAMLVFWQKGKGEWRRLIPRLVLSTLIWVTIGKSMFAFAMSGEINREIADETKAAVEKIQTGSVYEDEKKTLKEQVTEKQKTLKELKDDLLNAEREMEQEMSGVPVEDRTTGIVGKGPKYAIKSEVVEKARQRLETQGNTLDTEIQQLNGRVETIQSKIEAEAREREKVENAAAGPERRLRIMLRLMFANPLTALVWFILSLVLLIIETAPVLLKFFAEESDYDWNLRTIRELSLARHDRHMAVIEAVRSGNTDRLVGREVELTFAVREAMTNDIRDRIFSTSGFGRTRRNRTRVSFVAPVLTDDRFDVYLNGDEVETLTLSDLKAEADSFVDEIGRTAGLSLEAHEMRNTDGDLIEPDFLPLIQQILADGRVVMALR